MAERQEPEILDLDIFLPPPRIVRLTEREEPEGLPGAIRRALRRFHIAPPRRVVEFDLSQVSTRTTLQIEKYFNDFTKAGVQGEMEKAETIMYDLMEAACRPSCPQATKEWLQRNTTPEQIMKLFAFILEPLQRRAMETAAEMAKLGKAKAR